MRYIMVAALCVALASVAHGVDAVDSDERRTRIEALTAAYEALDRAVIESNGKTIVIKAEKGFVIVSFLMNRDEPIYGEDVHVTYDPSTKKVIEVEAR